MFDFRLKPPFLRVFTPEISPLFVGIVRFWFHSQEYAIDVNQLLVSIFRFVRLNEPILDRYEESKIFET